MSAELNKILYVEDDPDIQAVATMALETLGGFTLEVCSSGKEALEKGPGFEPDLFLFDVMMPELDGPSTLQRLRDEKGMTDVPVVFMTAKVLESELARYQDLGALGTIAKPFDPMALPDQLRQIWSRRND